MQSIKQQAIALIERLPENVSAEQLIEEIIIFEKIQRGIKQLDAGQGIEHENARKKLTKWLGARADGS
ncbi:MAG: hypothetical protein HS115_05105 [Spirochaetales bacterium]|nr:hypothetical protein [Spirochaetales bacterium]